MPIQNLESLLQPISADAPCGPDLEYDPAFLELDRLSQGKPEQQMGDTIVPAQEPDWKEVGNRALALLAKTKDLRIAMRARPRAVATPRGSPGLADGLAVLRGIVEPFWDGFYPKLDPEDDNDPTFRVNILMGLCDGDGLHRPHSPDPAGQRDAPSGGSACATSPSPRAKFRPCRRRAAQDVGHRWCLHRMSRRRAAGDGGCPARVVGQPGRHRGLRGREGRRFERHQFREADRRPARGGEDPRQPSWPVVGSASKAGPKRGADGSGGGASGRPIHLAARSTAARTWCACSTRSASYYERAEPSSPIPILLKRSKRLVSASFMDIVRDLASDGLAQVENLRGKDGTESS